LLTHYCIANEISVRGSEKWDGLLSRGFLVFLTHKKLNRLGGFFID
jgi:hypothetical protein